MTPIGPDQLTAQASDNIRRVPWRTILAATAGATTIGLLGAAGLAPLLAGLGMGTLASGPVVAWLTGMGANALAGWIGAIASGAIQAPFTSQDVENPEKLAELGHQIDLLARQQAGIADDLAKLLSTINAVPNIFDTLSEQVDAQTDVLLEQHSLLQKINSEVQQIGLHSVDMQRFIAETITFQANRTMGAINAQVIRADNRFTQIQALLEKLLDAQQGVHDPEQIRADINRLYAYSRRTSRLLARYSQIQMGTEKVIIQRRCSTQVYEMAQTGSVLVIGDPGSGKSGVLYAFAEAMRAEQRDVIYLSVDRFDVRSLSDLSQEMRIKNDFIDILERWQNSEPGFLIIDALDAARSEVTAQVFRDLIQLVLDGTPQWHIIASIRKFDLRHSHELQRLFQGVGSIEYRDPLFSNVRHVNVAPLTADELTDIAPQSPMLNGFLEQAPPKLHELLKTPFNLRIMADLLSEEGANESLNTGNTLAL